jgi:hypothetical protein
MATNTLRSPGGFAIPSTSPVYIDGIPASSVTPVSSAAQSQQKFWSSQPRYAGDPTAEELVISLGQARYVSYLSLELPHFPHAAYFWWWDGAQWQYLTTPSGMQLMIVTSGSVPPLVDSPAALNAGLNPYHYGAGHWVKHDEPIVPVTTSKILIHCLRPGSPAGQSVPCNAAGHPVPYPLGCRNLDIGCRVTTPAQVPPTLRNPVTLSQRQPFTTSSDVNGSPVQVAVRENRAADLLQGGTWRCAPQPSSSSVVNLYLDGRDTEGNAQTVSAFSLQPVTSGVRYNLYYSADAPPAGASFPALDDPVSAGLLTPGGSQFPAAVSQGLSFGTAPGWLDLSNQAAGTTSDSPWWAACEIMPSFASGDSGTYVVADAGCLQLSFAAGTWSVTVPDPGNPQAVPSGGVLCQWQFGFSQGDRLQFCFGWDGSSLFAWNPQGGLSQSAATTPPPSPVFRFGALQYISPSQEVLAGNYILTCFALKQQQISFSGGIPADFTAFSAGSSAYVTAPAGAPATQDAVARFHPQWVLGTVCPWGFVGGPGASFETCNWVQVPRSFTLSAGYAEFDPVTASCWKFEFTCLQAEPYDYLQPATAASQYFPPQAQPTTAQATPTTPAQLDAGLTVATSIAAAFNLGDAPPPVPAPPAAGTVLPTEALYAADPLSAARMSQAGGALYSFQQWQPSQAIPAAAGPSAYQQQSVPVTGRIAYFVAVSSISMYAVDYTQADDTAQYAETFANLDNVDTSEFTFGGWDLLPGTGLFTPSNLSAAGATAQSVVLSSSHTVTGLQFATVQSNPVQLLADSDFSLPGFPDWSPVGDAMPLTPSAEDSQLGTMVQVARGGAPALSTAYVPGSWAYLETSYSSWENLESLVPEWLDFGLPPASSSFGGIAYTGIPVTVSPGGRLYAAARVFTPVALSAPLYLQLLDGATGMVIAEAEQSVAGGSVTEWYAGFTVGQVSVSTNDWTAVQGDYPDWSDLEGLAWSEPDTTVTPLGQTVTAQVIQKQSTTDFWGVDNISVFDDALTWQFSNDGGASWQDAYDIRNNPRGALVFPAPASGQGTQLMWRVTGYRPGLVISGLVIRPWYQTWPRGIPPRPAGIGHGPNMSPADQYTSVENDPRWQMSSGPVPDDWYFAVRQILGVSVAPNNFPAGLPVPAVAEIGAGFAWEPAEVVVLDQTWTDIYIDVYTDSYAPADGGDVYTDTFCDVYGIDNRVITGTERSGEAAFSAAASANIAAIRIPLPAFGAGADLGPVSSSNSLVTAWVSGTGQQIPARRIALGNQIPASLAASDAAGDAGLRRVLFDVQPDATTTPAQLKAFLQSCQAGNLEASVSIWAGTDTAMANPADWLTLLPGYVNAIRLNGYQHVLVVSNAAMTSGWLNTWYPGDDLVDVIAPTFYCSGPAPGSWAPTLAGAAAFADAHGMPFGLSSFGADHVAYSAKECEAFISYVQKFFAARKSAAKQNYDLIWLGTGNYSVLTAPPGVLAAWRSMAEAFD